MNFLLDPFPTQKPGFFFLSVSDTSEAFDQCTNDASVGDSGYDVGVCAADQTCPDKSHCGPHSNKRVVYYCVMLIPHVISAWGDKTSNSNFSVGLIQNAADRWDAFSNQHFNMLALMLSPPSVLQDITYFPASYRCILKRSLMFRFMPLLFKIKVSSYILKLSDGLCRGGSPKISHIIGRKKYEHTVSPS